MGRREWVVTATHRDTDSTKTERHTDRQTDRQKHNSREWGGGNGFSYSNAQGHRQLGSTKADTYT